jgi:hypothetical protein
VKLIDGKKWGLYPGEVLPDDQFVQSTVEAVETPYRPSGTAKGNGVLTAASASAPGRAASDALAACRGGK